MIKKCFVISAVLIILFLLSCLAVSVPLDDRPFSKVLLDKHGALLSAKVSKDEQWRFELSSEIPDKLEKCILTYEDRKFYLHFGVNPFSIIRAARANRHAGKIVQGGSTLTMQLARLARNKGIRTYYQKLLEVMGAIKLELLFSKKEILKQWLEWAPYGGNIVGVESASWRYFDRSVDNLSWSEYALLAVLPNAPSLMHPGKNRDALKSKRNKLLVKLSEEGLFSKEDLELYSEEEIPNKPLAVPLDNIPFLETLIKKSPNTNLFHSTIDARFQSAIRKQLQTELIQLRQQGIDGLAAAVIDINNNEVKAYIGNLRDGKNALRHVDLNQAARSYGSLLKPFLYAYALEKGHCFPNELVKDVPLIIGDFRVENFDRDYRGAVSLDKMVNMSLNVPAVNLLKRVGMAPFYDELTKLDLDHLDRGIGTYGLSLILGGGESSLFSLTGAYAGLARSAKGLDQAFGKLKFLQGNKSEPTEYSLSDYAVYHTVEAMSDLTRPRSEQNWNHFKSAHKVAWKTGTSYGLRDAWTIGFDANYCIGVWVGNEDGESREGLVGVKKAAPIFFNLLKLLPKRESLQMDLNTPYTTEICAKTGLKKSKYCKAKNHDILTESPLWKQCDYHEVGLIKDDKFWPKTCLSEQAMIDTHFVLPPVMAHYYSDEDIDYKNLPPRAEACGEKTDMIEIIYPFKSAEIFLPVENTGQRRSLVIEIARKNEQEKVFWYMDDNLILESNTLDDLSIIPEEGEHSLLILTESGYQKKVEFRVVY